MTRIANPRPTEDDLKFEKTIRPMNFSEFIGQKKVKENLKIFVEAAIKRKESLDHVLLYGPPGLGKTSLSYIIANEMGRPLKTTSGPAIEKPGDLAAILTNLKDGEILFIDEIHRMPSIVEEILYPALEDFNLDLIIGQGPNARIYKLSIPKFTMIGATTRAGLITPALRGRFGIIHHLDFYSPEELKDIVKRTAKILNISINEEGAREVAMRSRGTPRIANRLLRRVRDFAEIKADGKITTTVARDALEMLEVDRMGFDEIDRKILSSVIDKFNGGPVGVGTIAASINEEKDTIEEVYEPFLIQVGFLVRTPRGRVATEKAFKHFEKEIKAQKKLF